MLLSMNAMDPDDPLDRWRWREDMLVTNPQGERVWLRPCYSDGGTRLGITDCCPDCCPEAEPCPRHQAVRDGAPQPWPEPGVFLGSEEEWAARGTGSN